MSQADEDACDPFRMRASNDRVESSHELFGAYARGVLYLQPALREAVVLGKTEDRIGQKKTENVLVDNENRVPLHSQSNDRGGNTAGRSLKDWKAETLWNR